MPKRTILVGSGAMTRGWLRAPNEAPKLKGHVGDWHDAVCRGALEMAGRASALNDLRPARGGDCVDGA